METKTGLELYKRIEDKMDILKDLLDTKIDDIENMSQEDKVYYNHFLKAIDKYSTQLAGRLTKAQWLEGMKNNEFDVYGTLAPRREHIYKYDHELGRYRHRHYSWGMREWNDCEMDKIPENWEFEFTRDIGGRASPEFMERCAHHGL